MPEPQKGWFRPPCCSSPRIGPAARTRPCSCPGARGWLLRPRPRSARWRCAGRRQTSSSLTVHRHRVRLCGDLGIEAERPERHLHGIMSCRDRASNSAIGVRARDPSPVRTKLATMSSSSLRLMTQRSNLSPLKVASISHGPIVSDLVSSAAIGQCRQSDGGAKRATAALQMPVLREREMSVSVNHCSDPVRCWQETRITRGAAGKTPRVRS